MNSNLTEIVAVLDRSGSMISCKAEAENGLNHFVDSQKQQPGDALFTLVQFDTEYEFVCQGRPIKECEKFELIPRGMTALLDAVGRAINETGSRLSAIDESHRPGLVVFVIVTDGGENSSHEFTRTQIKDLIERQQKDYNWQFTFLGANQDAFAEAASIGISKSAAANYSTRNSEGAYAALSANVTRMRRSSAQGQTVQCLYTPDERNSMS
jgi:hypothetical protein